MANRRMIHTKISYSRQVNSVSEFAQLLFTWIVPHLDDFGKIEGDPMVVKGIVMPLSSRPIEDFENAILELINVNLIERYESNEKKVITYLKFDDHQTGGIGKRTKSRYPDKQLYEINRNSPNFQEVQGNTLPSEENINEVNQKELNINKFNESEEEINKSEDNNLIEEEIIADEDSFNEDNYMADPHKHVIEDDGQLAAFEAWKTLEADSPIAFYTTYLAAYYRQLPTTYFYQFVSEIKQDDSINNPGAVFNNKVKGYFENLKGTNG